MEKNWLLIMVVTYCCFNFGHDSGYLWILHIFLGVWWQFDMAA
jgi:hypothetical protein